MKRFALLLVLLVAALSGGVGASDAAFVASSANPTTFSAAAVFNAVAVSLSDPGTPLRGTVALDATATSDRAIVSVRFQSSAAGAGAWTDRCTDTIAPYTCDWDSTAVTDGLYDLRAVALDASGYSQASTVAGRRVDNTAPTVSVVDPGSPLRATATVGATASDGGGIASVTIQRKPSSGSTWTTICTDATSPYSCAWNTATVTDGAYDLRATATDNAGRTATSALVTSRIVDNTGPRASAVTSTNTGTSGTLTAGDTLTLTFSEVIAPGSLVTGWTGADRSVSVAFTRAGTNTTVSVTDAATGSAVALGTITVTGRFTNAGGATFSGTMGQSGATVALSLTGTPTQGAVRADTVPTTINWTNSATVTDVAGNAGVATAVSGSGQL